MELIDMKQGEGGDLRQLRVVPMTAELQFFGLACLAQEIFGAIGLVFLSGMGSPTARTQSSALATRSHRFQ
jgi:hypothetical protein